MAKTPFPAKVSLSGRGIKIPHTTQCDQERKRRLKETVVAKKKIREKMNQSTWLQDWVHSYSNADCVVVEKDQQNTTGNSEQTTQVSPDAFWWR